MSERLRKGWVWADKGSEGKNELGKRKGRDLRAHASSVA